MEIAFIHPSYPHNDGSGSIHSATKIIDALQRRGHSVCVYCVVPKSSAQYSDCYASISTDRFPYHTHTIIDQDLQSLAPEMEEFDVVHSYITLSPAVSEISKHTTTVVTLNSYDGICPKMDLRYRNRNLCSSNGILKCFICCTLTSGDHPEYSRLYRIVSRIGKLRLVRKMDSRPPDIDGFQALSPHVKSTYSKFGFPEDKIEIIPPIIDEKFIQSQDRQFTQPFKLLYVGYLRNHKGVMKLPKIISRLDDELEYDIELTIVGDGELREKLGEKIQELELQQLIELRGHIPNDRLPSIYSNHDLFVYTGDIEEPFGRVFLEALGSGTPIVASDVGAVEQIIGNGGIVVDGTVRSYTTAIKEVIESGILPKLSSNAKNKSKEYTEEKVIRKIEKHYKSLQS